jgi:hypothetical protein
MNKYVRCVNPKAGSMVKLGAVYEVLDESTEGKVKLYVTRSGNGNRDKLRVDRFEAWMPRVGDMVVGPGSLARVLAEIDLKMFPSSCSKVGMRLLNPSNDVSEWLVSPSPGALPAGITPCTCTAPRQLNPQAADGKEGRDDSNLEKTLHQLFAEDTQRKLVAANVMAAETAAGPKLKPPQVGPESDPAFQHDETADGARKLKIAGLKRGIITAREAQKRDYAELVKLVGKEEADKV